MRYWRRAVVCTMCCVIALLARTGDAGAAGISFDIVQFNICSKVCTEALPREGASNTNSGTVPVNGFYNVMSQRGWPRVVSMNEVCGPGAWVMAAGLPASQYSFNWSITAHRPPNCGDFGNFIATRSDNLSATNATISPWWYGHTGPPPANDVTSEWRGGVCAEAWLGAEHLVGCTSHISPSNLAQIDLYRSRVNSLYGTKPRAALGDFNAPPADSRITAWDNDSYDDVLRGFSVTYDGPLSPGLSRHIDYGWYSLQFAGPDSNTTAYSSSSDHHMLWGGVHFK